MTNELLSSLILANLAAGAGVLGVLGLRRPVRSLLGARVAYSLWLVPPAAMLASLLPARTILVQVPAFQPVPPSQWAGSLAGPAAAVTKHAAPLDPTQGLTLLWLFGVAAGLLLLAASQRRALARFGQVTADADSPGLARASNPGVGPALLGVFRPRLIVPADFEHRFEPDEQRMILAHETSHLKSGHTLINGATALIRIVNWFNPLIHLGAHYARIDQELACDAAVVEKFPHQRRTYAQALLKTQLGAGALPLGCSWPARSGNRLEERVGMLANKSPGKTRLIAGAAGIALLTAGAGFAAWAAQPPVVRLAQGGAVGAALGAPAQPKVGMTQAPASVLQTTDPAPRTPEEIALYDAIDSGDMRLALQLGASPGDIYRMALNAGLPGWPANLDPSQARFVRTYSGTLAIGFSDSNGGPAYRSPAFGDYLPPGPLGSLPFAGDSPRFDPTPEGYPAAGPPQPTAEQLAIGQMAMSGASASQVADALIASMGPNAPAFDPSTARFVRGPNGDLSLSLSTSGGGATVVQKLVGGQNYPGLASLPVAPQIFSTR